MADTAVTVLLSTWNGEAFLADQLASFLAQSHPAWTLLWRDDGSRDASEAAVLRFGTRHPERLRDSRDQAGHLGVTESFLRLLRAAPAGLVAFADQDDVWLPDKLARGVAALQKAGETPALYCARQVLVDGQLQPLPMGAPVERHPGFPGALAQNIATGCTVMLNAAAARLVAGSRAPAGTLHDWWCYLVVSAAGGQVIWDDMPTVLYRQHGGNAVGVPLSPARRAAAALRRGPGVFMRAFRAHVAALLDQPELLSADARARLQTIASALARGPVARIGILGMPGLRRQTRLETALFRVWFVLG